MRAFILFLTLTFSPLASAGWCDWLMSSHPVKSGQINELISELKERNLNHLVAELENVNIVEKKSRRFWQKRISWSSPSFLFRFTNKPTIRVRISEWTSVEDKNLALYELAEALYQSSISSKLLSIRQMKKDLQWDDKALLDVSMNGTDEELMAYFLVIAPEQSSKQWVSHLKGLQSDIYKLLLDIDLPEKIKKLPDADKGRKPAIQLLLGWMIWDYSPKLNKADFLNYHRYEGSDQYNSTVENRYINLKKINWYTDAVWRILFVGILASTAPTAIDRAIQLPAVASKAYTMINNWSSIREAIEEGSKQMKDDLPKSVDREAAIKFFSLKKELQDLINKGEGSSPKAKEIQGDMDDLVESYPHIFKPQPPNN